MIISKVIEWDMGHRITNHTSLCRNLHGHRYKAEISVEGRIIDLSGDASEGMVIDFGALKEILNKEVQVVLDHGFMLWEKDKVLTVFFKKNSNFKAITVPFPPTAENIAAWIFGKLSKKISKEFKGELTIKSVKLWETPTSSAIFTEEDLK